MYWPRALALGCSLVAMGLACSSEVTETKDGSDTSTGQGATGAAGGSGGTGAGGAGGSETGGSGGADDCPDPMTCLDDDGACARATGQLGNGVCRSDDGSCFFCQCAHPDTPVATASGEVAIATLRPGDRVYTIDGGVMKLVPIRAVRRARVRDHHVMRVALDNGALLHISGGHPTAEGGRFSDLVPGMMLDGVAIVDVEVEPYDAPHTYDIRPDSDTGTYFAGGVLIGSTMK